MAPQGSCPVLTSPTTIKTSTVCRFGLVELGVVETGVRYLDEEAYGDRDDLDDEAHQKHGHRSLLHGGRQGKHQGGKRLLQ
jgi:hypothetical protein